MRNSEPVLKKYSWIIAAGIVIVGLSIFPGAYLVHLWNSFLNTCPARDVLSWDADLRWIAAIDIWNDFHRGSWFSGWIPFFDSPTWPPVRPYLSQIFFLIQGTPDPTMEVAVGYSFFLMLLASSFWIIAERTRSILLAGAGTFSISVLLLGTGEIPAYILSAMLETQGMFFMLWSFYAILRVYTNKENPQNQSFLKTLVLFSFGGLFFTKYPYGIMLFIGVLVYEIAKNPRDYRNFLREALSLHYGWIRRLAFLILPGLFVFLVLARYIDFETEVSPGKIKKILYPFLLFYFFDFQYFLWKHRVDVARVVPFTGKIFYLFGILPGAIWMILHPDRVMSIVDSQQHMQDASRSFFESLFFIVFQPAWIFPVLFLFGVFALAGIQWLRRTKEPDPLISAFLILVSQILILEYLTGNKQLRHIYHLLPVFLLALLLGIHRFLYLFTEKEIKTRLAVNPVLAVAVFLAGWIPGYFSYGIFAENAIAGQSICFTGNSDERILPARWYGRQVDPDHNYIIINDFHRPDHPGKGRQIAPDIDLFLRLGVWPSGRAENDSKYRFKNWEGFDRLLYISDRCDFSSIDELLKKRAGNVMARLRLDQVVKSPYEGFCIRKYSIQSLSKNGENH